MNHGVQLYLGGTFNPIHVGHARLALECHLLTGAKVYFVVSPRPPLKNEPEISLNHRVAMVERVINELNECVATNDNPVFHLELCELNMDGPSFTVNTLELLREQNPEKKIIWILGMDSLNTLEQWHNWRKLTHFANLFIVNRPNISRNLNDEVANWLAERTVKTWEALPLAGAIFYAATTPLAISSTDVRRRLMANQSCKYLLPESVSEYIRDHQLYL